MDTPRLRSGVVARIERGTWRRLGGPSSSTGRASSACPRGAHSAERFKPETKDAFTVAPEVVYSPIVPAELFVSKILSPRAVAGIAKMAAAMGIAPTAY
jgi:hypothetical protein